jgi:hypothetical protein
LQICIIFSFAYHVCILMFLIDYMRELINIHTQGVHRPCESLCFTRKVYINAHSLSSINAWRCTRLTAMFIAICELNESALCLRQFTFVDRYHRRGKSFQWIRPFPALFRGGGIIKNIRPASYRPQLPFLPKHPFEIDWVSTRMSGYGMSASATDVRVSYPPKFAARFLRSRRSFSVCVSPLFSWRFDCEMV